MTENSEKPKRYCYTIFVIQMLVTIKLSTSSSFRAVAKIAAILNLYLNLSFQMPSRTTILIWVEKIGYYQLTKPKPVSDDWVILLDHSISIGQKKLFMIYGIREKDIDFSRPLKVQDLSPLKQKCQKDWNGEIIKSILSELKKEIGHISYAVGDYGSDIKKGLELSNIPHIHDITHHIALIIKNIYGKHTEFQELTKKLSHMRMTLGQTHLSHLIPIKQRTKSRYQNINKISNYTMKILGFLDKTNDDPAAKKLDWLKNHRSLSEELVQINDVICKIEKIVKTNGLNKNTIKACKKILDTLTVPNGKQLKEQIKQYLDKTLKFIPGKHCILCTSDIIESAFGQYKNYLSPDSMAGITGLSLSLSAFTCSLKKGEIKDALEQTKINDLQSWIQENLGTTLYQKRKLAFENM